jgi:hypothetical protein
VVRPRGFEPLTFGSGGRSQKATDDHRKRPEPILQGYLATCDFLQQPPSTTDCQPIVSRPHRQSAGGSAACRELDAIIVRELAFRFPIHHHACSGSHIRCSQFRECFRTGPRVIEGRQTRPEALLRFRSCRWE